jgi:hypothetical protein
MKKAAYLPKYDSAQLVVVLMVVDTGCGVGWIYGRGHEQPIAGLPWCSITYCTKDLT